MHRTPVAFLVVALLAAPGIAQSPEPSPPLPKVVLIGDSIRLGYAPLVAKRLEGKAIVVNPEPNGADSANVSKNLEAWVIKEKPDLVHLNCGLHDLKFDKKAKTHQVPLEDYRNNLRAIVSRISQNTTAKLVFANTTPILDDRHAKRGANFDRFEADVQKYNAAAREVMAKENVPLHDLHGIVEDGGTEKLLGKDGTHYTPEGYQRLAAAVADCILRHLDVHRFKPAPVPPPDAKAGEAYRKAEAERDAQVAPVYRKLAVPDFKVPADAAAWKERRPDVLKKVVASLGDLPPRPSPQKVRLISRELRPGYTLEKIAIDNGVDNEVSALLLVPEKRQKSAPAVLCLHSSSRDNAHILYPNSHGGDEPLGEVLVQLGFVVLSPDAYWHGDRAGTGPGGPSETGRAEQESLFKLNLWLGRTLWGMYVRDDQIALDYLCSRPEVDRKRIGATGMSMGSTRAWWLAAVDERIAAVAGVACLTRYQNLIAHGQLKAHGVYYFADGLLKHFDSEGVLALLAPRPFLAVTGELDAGSPADGIKVLEEKVGGVYRALDADKSFRSVRYADTGHVYTSEMRKEMLTWFQRWLQQ